MAVFPVVTLVYHSAFFPFFVAQIDIGAIFSYKCFLTTVL